MPRKIVCSLFGLLALAVLLGALAPPAHDQTPPQKPRGDVFSGNGGGKPPPRTPRGERENCGCPAADSQEGRRQSEKQRYDPILGKLDSWDANEEVHYQAQLSNISRTTGRERQMALADIKLDHQRELARLNFVRAKEDLCHKCYLDWISQCCQGRRTIFCSKVCFGEDENGGNSNERKETGERESEISRSRRTPRGGKSNERKEYPAERESGISKATKKGKYIFDDPKIQVKYDQEVVRYEEEKARIIRAEKDNNYLHRSNLSMAKKGSEMARIERARFKRTSTQISSDRVANETLHKKVMDSLPQHYEPY